MRVSGNQNHVQQMCALYNKGIGAGFCADNFLKACGKKAADFLKECRKRAADFLTKTGSYLKEAGKRTVVFLKNTAAFLKINEKKLSDYLVVSNNLRTLSLSLSLSSTGVNKSLFLSLVRARGTPYKPM